MFVVQHSLITMSNVDHKQNFGAGGLDLGQYILVCSTYTECCSTGFFLFKTFQLCNTQKNKM